MADRNLRIKVGDVLDFTRCGDLYFRLWNAFWGVVTEVRGNSASLFRGTKEEVLAKKRELGI